MDKSVKQLAKHENIFSETSFLCLFLVVQSGLVHAVDKLCLMALTSHEGGFTLVAFSFVESHHKFVFVHGVVCLGSDAVIADWCTPKADQTCVSMVLNKLCNSLFGVRM